MNPFADAYDTPTEVRLAAELARLREAAAMALTQLDGLAAAWGNPTAFGVVRGKLRDAIGEGK